MGALRTKMIEEMKLRSFSPRTQKSYVAAVVGLVKHYHRSPDQIIQDEIRSYLLHLEERGLSANSRNVAISGLKFFYQQILGWNEEQLFLPPRKRTWRLPEVLSPREVERLGGQACIDESSMESKRLFTYATLTLSSSPRFSARLSGALRR